MADDILKNIPLPADLPENWTSGQIIAPTGAEAGLDDRHGYNYLMRQVNNAQKALKALAAQREEDLAKIKFWASPDPTSPAELFGGTWERIEGRFIMGASDTYPAGSTGGSATHTQTENEIAKHNVLFPNTNSGSGLTVPAGGIRINVLSDATTQVFTFPEEQEENSNYYRLPEVGDSRPMNIINPYYSMYIWRRVA
mgnify:CR=1 FL=1